MKAALESKKQLEREGIEPLKQKDKQPNETDQLMQ
jgi:hypothetical protein